MRTTINHELMFPSDPLMLWVELGKLRPITKAPFTQAPPPSAKKSLPVKTSPGPSGISGSSLTH